MNTLFYITSLPDVNFTSVLAREYSNISSKQDDKIFGFTHNTHVKYKLSKVSDHFETIFSESEISINSSNSQLTQEEIIKITEFEKKTNSNLWKFVYQDRWLVMKRRGFLYKEGTVYNRNELIRIILCKFEAIEQYLTSNKIDKLIFVTQDVGTSSASLLYEVTKYLKIEVVCPTISKFGNYFFLNNTIYSKVDKLEKAYDEIVPDNYDKNKRNDIVKIYSEIVTENKATYNAPKIKSNILNKLKSVLNQFYSYYSKGFYRDPKLKSPILYYIDKYAIWSNKNIIKIFFKFDTFSINEKYIFFPLHLEPELVLLLHASYYSDQISIIRNIAKSLPADTVLLVKDHPIALGRRNISFYKRLKKIPNVKILSPNIKSADIIKHCICVTTITGTAGIESFYYKKPTVTFGNVFYNFLDSVVKVKNFEELPMLWSNIKKYTPKENDILKYLFAIHESAYKIDLLGIIKNISELDSHEILMYKSSEISEYVKFLKHSN